MTTTASSRGMGLPPEETAEQRAELLASARDGLALNLLEQKRKSKSRLAGCLSANVILEARAPIFLDSAHLDFQVFYSAKTGFRPEEIKHFTTGHRMVVEQPVICAPKHLEGEARAMMADPVFWAARSSSASRATAEHLERLGFGQYAKRAMSADAANSVSGTSNFDRYFASASKGRPLVDDSIVDAIDIEITDEVPFAMIDANSTAGEWVAENAALTSAEEPSTTRMGEFDAHCYLTWQDITDKLARNSWAIQLGLYDALMMANAGRAGATLNTQATIAAAKTGAPDNIHGQFTSETRNVIASIVKNSAVSVDDLLKVRREFAAEYMSGNFAWMAGRDALERIESDDRRITNREMPNEEFRIRGDAVYLNPDLEAMAPSKHTGLWAGDFKAVKFRRSSIWLFATNEIMAAGQTQLISRAASFGYFDYKVASVVPLEAAKAGPIAAIQPNRT